MASIATLTFEEASAQYRKFLRDNDYPDDIVWVTAQDILFTGRPMLYVKLPVSDRNLQHVRELFEAAMTAQSGVSFSTVCKLGAATCCRVWVPIDNDERQRAMCPRDLKLSANQESSLRTGKVVQSKIHWWWLRFWYGKHQSVGRDFFWG